MEKTLLQERLLNLVTCAINIAKFPMNGKKEIFSRSLMKIIISAAENTEKLVHITIHVNYSVKFLIID